MKQCMTVMVVLLLGVSLSAAARRPSGQSNLQWIRHLDRLAPGSYAQGEVVVKLRSTYIPSLQKGASGLPSLDALLARVSTVSFAPMFKGHPSPPADPSIVDLSRYFIVRYGGPSDAVAVAKTLMQADVVEIAEPRMLRRTNFIPDDPGYTAQYHLPQIHAVEAWDITQGDSTVVIAVVDTGVKLDHEDLNANIWHNPGEMGLDANGNDKRFNGIDDDGDGFIDDWTGWDFEPTPGHPDGDNDPDPGPLHGTHVAGIAAAVTNNGIGVSGVAPHCRILPVKVSPDDPNLDIVDRGDEGIVYAADRGASIINCSWSGPSFSVVEQDVVAYAVQKGALIIAAAGNTEPALDIDLFGAYPASYAKVMAVGSVNRNDEKSSFSNFGYKVAVSAPGEFILSTTPPNGYQYLSGTSMSTPMVCGVAALVKSLNPAYTPLQLAQRVRVTSDNINSINPSEADLMGYGRINAYNAIAGSPSPAMRLSSFSVSDSSTGNGDGVFQPNETITIGGTLVNYLDPTENITATLTSTSPYVTIENPTQHIRPLGTLDSTAFAEPIRVKIAAGAPENQTVVCVLRISAGQYHDFDVISFFVHPTYQNMNENQITMTVTSKGTFAYNDYPSNLQGAGFVFQKSGPDNLLFEGALMAGTDPSHVVDAARGAVESVQDTSFSILSNFAISKEGTIADQEGHGLFDDAGAGSSRLGLQIRYGTFAYRDSSNDGYVIVRYDMKNLSGSELHNLCAGLFLDWDIGTVTQNIAAIDSNLRLGYAHDSAAGGVPAYVGVTVLGTDPISFRAINNADTGIVAWGVYDGFTNTEKWEALSQGVSAANAGPSDISMVIGARHGTLGASDSAVFPFAFVAAETLDQLRVVVAHARAKWDIIKDISSSSGTSPTAFALEQNYPNPFNNSTVIHYSIERQDQVTLKVYDILGREIETLVDFAQSPGRYSVVFPKAKSLASGVYFYRLSSGGSTLMKKMVYLK